MYRASAHSSWWLWQWYNGPSMQSMDNLYSSHFGYAHTAHTPLMDAFGGSTIISCGHSGQSQWTRTQWAEQNALHTAAVRMSFKMPFRIWLVFLFSFFLLFCQFNACNVTKFGSVLCVCFFTVLCVGSSFLLRLCDWSNGIWMDFLLIQWFNTKKVCSFIRWNDGRCASDIFVHRIWAWTDIAMQWGTRRGGSRANRRYCALMTRFIIDDMYVFNCILDKSVSSFFSFDTYTSFGSLHCIDVAHFMLADVQRSSFIYNNR